MRAHHQLVVGVGPARRQLTVADETSNIIPAIEVLLDQVSLRLQKRRRKIANVVEEHFHAVGP
jgi:hypothetical protein